MIWNAIVYFFLDVLVAFFLGVTIGVVAARVAKYLLALAISILAALAYFMKRGLITISWNGLTSSIRSTLILNYHTYGIILGIFLAIGFVVGVAFGLRGRKKEKERREEIQISREPYSAAY